MAASQARAARLRHRVTLEVGSPAANGALTWTALATVWASITPLDAAAAERGGHVGGRASHRIVIRHRADVTSSSRVVVGARRFSVLATYDPDETRRALVLLAEEDDR
jgi:SPP1 family predicted phage head-tail adaptor